MLCNPMSTEDLKENNTVQLYKLLNYE